jgi:uncharacterized membrane protein
MARTAVAAARVPLAPHEARDLWADLDRWPTFVDGFASALERPPEWPAEGSKLVWQSTAAGRGRVTERVVESAPDRIVTDVFEEALNGTQTVRFRPSEEGGSVVELSLEYELSEGGPLRALSDALFIRRAQRDALRRTLRRFRIEAEEDASLR